MQKSTDHETCGKESLCKERTDVTEEALTKEQKTNSAWLERRSLTMNLMEKICHRNNLNEAYKKVVSNKGAAGVDGMSVLQLKGWIKKNKDTCIASLMSGSYKPMPVKKVTIPKPGGGERMLGIPTVVDRLVQQAILQVLDPIIDPTFSKSSYGFRKGIGAHDALKDAQAYVAEGRSFVVDMDLEKFFDKVNHDMVMARLARHVGDKRLLLIVRRFLQAGMMDRGTFTERDIGTPQGGPLSPLLANLLLDDLDKELEKRGHKFCRYADDCNIYVKSQPAAERVLKTVKAFVENKLKLKVNDKKSAAARTTDRSFLGYVLRHDGKLLISRKSMDKFKDKVRAITKRSRGKKLETIVKELNSVLRGWCHYFKLHAFKTMFKDLDGWIRRKLRCYRLKQRKRCYSIVQWLIALGIKPYDAWCIGKSNKGWWRLSHTPQLDKAMNNTWFENELKLISLLTIYNNSLVSKS